MFPFLSTVAAKLASVVKSFDFSSILVPIGTPSTSTRHIDDLELDSQLQQIDEIVVDNDKNVAGPSTGILDASAIGSSNEPQLGKSENKPEKSQSQHSDDSVTKGASDQELLNTNVVSTDEPLKSQVNKIADERDKEPDMVEDERQWKNHRHLNPMKLQPIETKNQTWLMMIHKSI